MNNFCLDNAVLIHIYISVDNYFVKEGESFDLLIYMSGRYFILDRVNIRSIETDAIKILFIKIINMDNCNYIYLLESAQ